MNWKIRTIKTKGNNFSVQIYRIENRIRVDFTHVGSASIEEEIGLLKTKAENLIQKKIQQTNNLLFPLQNTNAYFKHYKYLNFSYTYAYEFLEKVFNKFNLNLHLKKLWKDLIISQLLEPSSKRQNLLNLEYYFGIKYNLNALYNFLSKFDEKLKTKVEAEIIKVAKKEYKFDFSFVLYDVTTLYFESFKNDEFKTPGFSKDHKHNQPQIVIGLVVTKEGFPVHHEVFSGNTNEGKTFLPSILDFKKEHKIQDITVVADSAMLSKQNLKELIDNKVNYIISARLANLSKEKTFEISQNFKTPVIDKYIWKTEYTDDNDLTHNLIIQYKEDRKIKDEKEMEKQLEKAKKYEGKITTKITKLKFLKNTDTKYSINTELLDKTKILLGLKGYVTNLNLPDAEIIDYYHNLFRVEHAFRIAKSDLEIRPIYLQKKTTINLLLFNKMLHLSNV